MTTTEGTASRLTDHDRDIIAQARELAALPSIDAIRERTGEHSLLLAYAFALGEAQERLAELAAIAERLDGADPAGVGWRWLQLVILRTFCGLLRTFCGLTPPRTDHGGIDQ
jgi:hypothetical protein